MRASIIHSLGNTEVSIKVKFKYYPDAIAGEFDVPSSEGLGIKISSSKSMIKLPKMFEEYGFPIAELEMLKVAHRITYDITLYNYTHEEMSILAFHHNYWSFI